jgi:hypothetical protein
MRRDTSTFMVGVGVAVVVLLAVTLVGAVACAVIDVIR